MQQPVGPAHDEVDEEQQQRDPENVGDDDVHAHVPAEQRDAMVLGMVQRLTERLHREGGDPESWARLARSYLVLGKAEDARAAAIDARQALAHEPEKLRRLNELLRELGIEG